MLATPAVAGLVDLIYVIHLGGDYMHARLLLPAFFAVCLPVFVSSIQMRSIAAVPVVGILVWAVVCAGWLRYVPPPGSLNPQVIFISNERNSWITATGNPHPVTAGDYRHALSGQAGAVLRRMSHQVPRGAQTLLVVTDPYAPLSQAPKDGARSPLPFTLAVNVPAIGVIGYLAGPDVYIFDDYSLANPIGSHTIVTVHARPGHEKYIGPAWMLARFGSAPPTAPTPPTASGQPSSQSVAAAREALACDPLSSYLHAITAPMSLSLGASNFLHSFSYSSMSFSADPTEAVRQLCGNAALPPQP
jgi:arabinofuranosyltransferase